MSLQWHRLRGLGFRPAIRPHLTPFVRSHHNLFRGHRFVQERDLSLRSTSLGSLGEDALHLVGRPTGATWRDLSIRGQRRVFVCIVIVVLLRERARMYDAGSVQQHTGRSQILLNSFSYIHRHINASHITLILTSHVECTVRHEGLARSSFLMS